MKHTFFQYRTGTLYDQKHAVRYKRSTSLTCPLPDFHHMDSALLMRHKLCVTWQLSVTILLAG
eukprot:645232-Pelagomonas_calceolata.AAC.1